MKRQEQQQQWFEHVKAWRASGQTQRVYAAEHGLRVSTLSHWSRREKIDAKPVSFVPAALAAPPAELILRAPGGWQLVLPREVSVQWLADLLGRVCA